MSPDAVISPSRTKKRMMNKLAQKKYRQRRSERRLNGKKRLEYLQAEKERLRKELNHHPEEEIDPASQQILPQTPQPSEGHFTSQCRSDCGLEMEHVAADMPGERLPSLKLDSSSEDSFQTVWDQQYIRDIQASGESAQSLGSQYLTSDQQDRFYVCPTTLEPIMTAEQDPMPAVLTYHGMRTENPAQSLPYGVAYEPSGYLSYTSMNQFFVLMVPFMVSDPGLMRVPQMNTCHWNWPLVAGQASEACY
jgi:hypothetical protein